MEESTTLIIKKPVRKKPTNNNKKRPKKKKKQNKRAWYKKLFSVLVKLGLVSFIAVVIYGIHLDRIIQARIDGNVWNLPAAVYGQITDLEPDSDYSINDVISLLNGAQYRQQTTKAMRPGEYVVGDESIEIYRRPFVFPDGEEQAFRVKITFAEDRIEKMTNLDTWRDFGLLRIDPKLITMLRSAGGEQRLFSPLKTIPDSLVQTLIATEDRRFYEHSGISLSAIARALYVNITTGRTEGGSTLTQQTVKNLFLSNERSIIRKIREAYMALILDARYSKERILELYLNEVYLGQSGDEEIHGFPLASLYYFGRPVNELTLDQQALIVGMVKGASFYNPWSQPVRALERRNVVLKVAQEQGIIDEELYNLLSARPLGVLPKGQIISPQPDFMQIVRNELRKRLGDKANNLSGMKIFTTFDPLVQDAADKGVVTEIAQLRKFTKLNLEAAMVVVNRETGEIRAVVGSSEPNYAGYNRAWLARRQIGSLAKPSTYLTALNMPERYQLNSWLEDKPLSIELANGNIWEPRNFSGDFLGKVKLIDALKLSLNIPTVNLGLAIGLDGSKVILERLGVPADRIPALPSRLLGALELTPFETAQMFQTIANNGQRSELSILRYVLGEKGELVYQSFPKKEQAVSPQAAYLTMFAMQQAADSGTARALKRKYGEFKLAAKTGTSNDFRDSWFAGMDGKNVAIIWVGLDDNQPMRLTGSSGALKIYSEFLNNAQPKPLNLPMPQDIYMVPMNSDGEWQCNGTEEMEVLPAWTGDPQKLCDAEDQSSDKIMPDWISNMFGK